MTRSLTLALAAMVAAALIPQTALAADYLVDIKLRPVEGVQALATGRTALTEAQRVEARTEAIQDFRATLAPEARKGFDRVMGIKRLMERRAEKRAAAAPNAPVLAQATPPTVSEMVLIWNDNCDVLVGHLPIDEEFLADGSGVIRVDGPSFGAIGSVWIIVGLTDFEVTGLQNTAAVLVENLDPALFDPNGGGCFVSPNMDHTPVGAFLNNTLTGPNGEPWLDLGVIEVVSGNGLVEVPIDELP